MIDIVGRTAFITGGAQGIGLGIARRLAREGVKLAIVDIDANALEAAKQELMSLTTVATFVLDVRDREAYERIANEVESTLGNVSLLFNNAGVAPNAHVTTMSYESWDWSLDINLGGVINGIQTFLPRMIKKGDGGHIVNTASGAGVAPTSHYLYCTPKYAVVGMSETLRAELGKIDSGISVSVLCPGPVATGIVSRSALAQPGIDDKQTLLNKLKGVEGVLQQGVSADDVGEMVLNGILNDKPFIFTDRIVEDILKERTADMLACMPVYADEQPQAVEAKSETWLSRLFKQKPNGPQRTALKGFTLEVELPAKLEDVFALIGNPSRMGEWSPEHVAFPSPPPANLVAGSTFSQTMMTSGNKTRVDWTVVEYKVPKILEMDGLAQPGIKLQSRYEFEKVGNRTLLRVTMGMGGTILLGPLGKSVRQQACNDLAASLEKLKDFFGETAS